MNTKTNSIVNTSSICQNCDYLGSCLYESSSDKPILYCGEYHVTKPKKNDSEQVINIENKIFEGLCSTCDFKAECTFRNDNQVVINCEHYQ